VKKLMKARRKLGLADTATRARLVGKLVRNADHLLDAANALVARAQSGGVITGECAATLTAFLASLGTCVAGLPGA
jgi:hypothetical protein